MWGGGWGGGEKEEGRREKRERDEGWTHGSGIDGIALKLEG